MDRIGIVGAGLVGRAWAIVFARAGLSVVLHDRSDAILDASFGTIDTSLADLAAAGLLREPPAAVRARMARAATLADALAGATYVQESLPELPAVKREIFAAMDAIAAPDTILASSTSAIPGSSFTEGLKGRARCLVVHPVNPPHLVPLVELCGAPWTAPEVIQRTRVLMERAGQVPITVKRELEGFILNRLQAALLNEAFRLIDQGYVSADDLDKTVKDGLGLRWAFMGPMETIDLNAPAGVADYLARYSPFFRRVDTEIRAAAPWRDELGARLEQARRQQLPAARLGERAAWRDRRLMALLAHKASFSGEP
ncbi:MAG: 3-hydroxyacyl-CoA dehydrogenase [Proteobacteria bacterium]|nr:3-hydroxyacyl-CoA dehydrogenase [Pseudomonadota bacterium]